jgi:hypothetical protein
MHQLRGGACISRHGTLICQQLANLQSMLLHATAWRPGDVRLSETLHYKLRLIAATTRSECTVALLRLARRLALEWAAPASLNMLGAMDSYGLQDIVTAKHWLHSMAAQHSPVEDTASFASMSCMRAGIYMYTPEGGATEVAAEAARCRQAQAKERRAGLPRARLELRVELRAHEERVIRQLHNLHPLPLQRTDHASIQLHHAVTPMAAGPNDPLHLQEPCKRRQ